MAKIVPNDLLNPTEKTIKNWNCSFIAVEGPNILDKLSLEDLAIPYESQYRSRIVLKAGDVNQPLIYGFLGKAVTFLMIKVTYDSTNDPYYQYEQEKYSITYYFENDPILRPLNRLMTMTGSVDNKIPQIYLNNPYDYDVVLDVMHASIDSEYDSGTTIAGFEMSNISDVLFSGLTSGETLYYNGTEWTNMSLSGFSGGSSGTSGSSGIDGTSGSSGITPVNSTSNIRLFITNHISNNSIFYFNIVTKIAESSDSPGNDCAFLVTVGSLTSIKIYLRDSITNSTTIEIYKSENGAAFSSASLFASGITSTITQDTVTLFTFSGLTINQYDSIFIRCTPTLGDTQEYYGIVIIE